MRYSQPHGTPRRSCRPRSRCTAASPVEMPPFLRLEVASFEQKHGISLPIDCREFIISCWKWWCRSVLWCLPAWLDGHDRFDSWPSAVERRSLLVGSAGHNRYIWEIRGARHCRLRTSGPRCIRRTILGCLLWGVTLITRSPACFGLFSDQRTMAGDALPKGILK